MPKTTKKYVKIGEASKSLGVSIDTLRRWGNSGKISSIRTPGGTRLYSISTLDEMIKEPAAYQRPDKPLLSTVEDLLTHLENDKTAAHLPGEPEELSVYAEAEIPEESSVISHQTSDKSSIINHKSLIINRFYVLTAFSGLIACLAVTFLVLTGINYFTPNPSGNIAKIEEFKSFIPAGTNITRETKINPDVLAAATSNYYLDIDSDVIVEGSMAVGGSINGLTLTPGVDGFTIAGGTSSERTLTILNGDVTLDQDLSTTSSPSFNALSLVSPVLSIAGVNLTLTGTDTTQTLTNKSMSGSSNTFTNIPNSALSNNKVTVTAGTNLSGGGDVTLGSSITLTLKDALGLADGTAAAPSYSFSSDTDTGLYRIGANSMGLITGGSATSGITIDATGNLGVGTIAPAEKLDVAGRVHLLQTTAPSTITDKLYNVSGALIWNGIDLSSGGALPVGTAGQTLYHNAGSWTATSNLFNDGTNVGIGTTNPLQKLDLTSGSSYGIAGTSVLNATTLGSGVITSSLTTVGALASGSIASGFGTISTGNTITTSGTMGTADTTTFTGAGATFTSINNSGVYTQSGVSANTFTGTSTFSNATYSALFTGGNVGIGTTSPLASLHNAGGTLFGTLSVLDKATGGNIGTAATTVNIYTAFNLSQTTVGQTITLPDPTDTTAGRIVYLSNTGSTPFTFYGSTVKVGDTTAAMWDGNSWNLAGGGGLAQGTVANSTLYWNNSSSQWLENTAILTQINPTADASSGLSVSNSGAVTGTGYGGYFTKTGASTTNIGLYSSASGGTNNYAAIFADGNVGIGTTAPGALFDVNGTARVATLNATSAIQLNGTSINTGGTLTNVAYLDTANVFTANQNFNAGFDVDNAFVVADGGALTTSQLATFNNNLLFGTSTGILGSDGNVGIGTTAPVSLFDVNNKFNVLAGGNVGIGTTNPGQKLEVAGAGYFSTGAYIGANNTNNLISSASTGAGTTPLFIGNKQIATSGSGGTITGATNQVGYFTGTDTLGGSNNFWFDGTNVGIGTTSPDDLFVVSSNADTQVRFESYSSTANLAPYFFLTRGRGDQSSPTIVQSGDLLGSIHFMGTDRNQFPLYAIDAARIKGEVDGTPGQDDMPGRLVFMTTPDGSNISLERMRITSTGNVGVGTTNPSALFSVGSSSQFQVNSSGNVTFASTLTPTSNFTLGSASYTGALTTSDWGISSIGALTGITGITNDGSYTQSGTSANTFTGTSTFSNATYSALFTGGNVGIGTTNPLQKLDLVTGSSYGIAGIAVLSGTTLGTGVLTSSLTTVGALNSGSITSGFGAIDVGADSITTTGTIGTASTTTFTGAGFTGTTGVFSTSTTSPLMLGGTAVGSSLTLQSTSGVGTTDFIKFAVGNNGATEAMRITNDGNVGIGTTNPTTAKLTVSGGNIGVDSGRGLDTNTAAGTLNLGTTNATTTNIGLTAATVNAYGLNAVGYQIPNALGDTEQAMLLSFDNTLYDSRSVNISTSSTISPYQTGIIAQAFAFGGNSAGTRSSYVTFSRGTQIAGNNYDAIDGNQGSVSLWIKPGWGATTTGNKTVFEFPSLARLIYNATTDTFDFGYWNGSEYTTVKVSSAVQTFSSGSWIYLAVTWDADISPYLQIKVNTEAIAQYTSGVFTAQAPAATNYLGTDQNGQNSVMSYIDDLIITGNVLRQNDAGTVTTSSNTVTGTSTAFTKLLQNGYPASFKLSDDATIYTISTIASDTSLTLVTAPSTHASATNYQAGEMTALYNGGTGQAATIISSMDRKFYATFDGSGTPTTTISNMATGSDWRDYNVDTNPAGQWAPNGTMEAATTGTPTSWTAVGSPTLADAEAANILFDTRSQKITVTGISKGMLLTSDLTVAAGQRYRIQAYLKSDGTNRANLRVRDVTGSADITTVGTTSSVWTLVTTDVLIPASSVALNVYIESGTAASYAFYADNIGVWKLP